MPKTLAFTKMFGKPDPGSPCSVELPDAFDQSIWAETQRQVGAGWFMNRFLYLFGQGLERLHACLDAWTFLVPPAKDRLIVGRNAYGALLVLENASAVKSRIHVLDPFRVVYWSDPNFNLLTLVDRWLPQGLIPNFLDDDLYRLWMRGDDHLAEGTIIAPLKPEGLGGTFTPDNVQEEEIISYYQTTGPIYAKAFAEMATTGKRPASKRRMPAPPAT